MRTFNLPSGATLTVTPAPFSQAKALYQALLRELRHVPVTAKTDVASVVKDLFCSGFSSPEIEACLNKCLERCLYDGGKGAGPEKFTDQTFEPVERRDDYILVCMEVARENVFPFAKSLYAEFQKAQAATPAGAPQ